VGPGLAGCSARVERLSTRTSHLARYRFHVTACNNDGVWNDVGTNWTSSSRLPGTRRTGFSSFSSSPVSLLHGSSTGCGCARLQAASAPVPMNAWRNVLAMARELHDIPIRPSRAARWLRDDALEQSGECVRLQRAMEQLSIWLGQAVNEGRAAL